MFQDWQAYEDGSLSNEERAQAEMILQTDRQARAELDGLREFREAIKRAGQSEAVPQKTLDEMLKRTASTHSRPSRTLFLPIGLAVAAAVILGLVVGPKLLDQVNPAPKEAVMASSNPQELQTWLVSNTHQPAPLITAQGCGARLVDGKYGPGWIAWDIEMNHQTYSIVGKKKSAWNLSNLAETQYQGSTYLLKGDDVGWECELDMVYFVSGGTSQGRLEVARAARRETPSIIRV